MKIEFYILYLVRFWVPLSNLSVNQQLFIVDRWREEVMKVEWKVLQQSIEWICIVETRRSSKVNQQFNVKTEFSFWRNRLPTSSSFWGTIEFDWNRHMKRKNERGEKKKWEKKVPTNHFVRRFLAYLRDVSTLFFVYFFSVSEPRRRTCMHRRHWNAIEASRVLCGGGSKSVKFKADIEFSGHEHKTERDTCEGELRVYHEISEIQIVVCATWMKKEHRQHAEARKAWLRRILEVQRRSHCVQDVICAVEFSNPYHSFAALVF